MQFRQNSSFLSPLFLVLSVRVSSVYFTFCSSFSEWKKLRINKKKNKGIRTCNRLSSMEFTLKNDPINFGDVECPVWVYILGGCWKSAATVNFQFSLHYNHFRKWRSRIDLFPSSENVLKHWLPKKMSGKDTCLKLCKRPITFSSIRKTKLP